MNQLPEGWGREEFVNGQVVFCHPKSGFVTLNYQRRNFAIGYGACVAYHPDNVYTGRGWRERLEADAIAALNKIYEGKK